MLGDFVLFVAVGFAAQLVDGAIGMTYGLSGTTVMLSFGIPPATASASVHAAEVFTTGISGFSHWRFGNVDWAFVSRLALPGMVGGAIGAYLLTTIPGETVAPFMNAYLLILGTWIVWKAFRQRPSVSDPPRWLVPLGFGGGFLDAIGGRGWGPMVTSTLLGTARRPGSRSAPSISRTSSSPRRFRRPFSAPHSAEGHLDFGDRLGVPLDQIATTLN
jgi:uncharacterized protein